MSLFLAILACTGLYVGGHFGWLSLRAAKQLQVRRITVSGNQRVSADEIKSFAGVEIGTPLLDVDLDQSSAQIRKHPWIAEASILRHFPDGIAIHVAEHTPVLVVNLGELYLANARGMLFKKVAWSDHVTLPVLSGLSRERIVADPDSHALLIQQAQALVVAAREYGETFGSVHEIRFDEDLGWSLYCKIDRQDDLVELRLGHRPIERMPTAAVALERIRLDHQRASVIWANGEKNPHRVHVVLRSSNNSSSPLTALVTRGE